VFPLFSRSLGKSVSHPLPCQAVSFPVSQTLHIISSSRQTTTRVADDEAIGKHYQQVELTFFPFSFLFFAAGKASNR
jgi:hypothetical protein